MPDSQWIDDLYTNIANEGGIVDFLRWRNDLSEQIPDEFTKLTSIARDLEALMIDFSLKVEEFHQLLRRTKKDANEE